MSHFNLLEAKVDFNGENVLEIEAELHRLLIPPYTNVLIRRIGHSSEIEVPYKIGNTCSLPEFTNKLYMWHFSLINDIAYPNAQIKINTKRVDSIDD